MRLPGYLLAMGGAAATAACGFTFMGLRVGAPLVVVGLGGAALAMVGLALYRALDPLLRPEAVRGDGPRDAGRVRALEREKQMVLKAIREIEFDYQMRKIAEADYQEMTQRYRTRAMRLLRELDAGDDYRSLIEQELKTRLGALEAAGARACAACGGANDSDAQFCKKCGATLTA